MKIKSMKLFSISFLLLFISFRSLCQDFPIYISDINDGKEIKNGISLKSTSNGWIIMNSKGIQYKSRFAYIESISNGVITYCDKVARRTGGDLVGEYCDGTKKKIHIFEIMKELGDIDDYYFDYERDLRFGDGRFYFEYYVNSFTNFEVEKIIDPKGFGYASKNGKFALINRLGDILTPFKYNNRALDSYTEIDDHKNKSTLFVKLDSVTGKEQLITKDSITRYWNPKSYITKNLSKNKYYLIHDSKKHIIPKHLITFIRLPIEGGPFTYRGSDYSKKPIKVYNGFLNANFEEISSKTNIGAKPVPVTNFYKNRCLVADQQTFKIINEKFETVKILPNVKFEIATSFNKYGNLIVDDGNSSFVIDYQGNTIIPPATINNRRRIKEVYEGIYQVIEHSDMPMKDENESMTNFYNQKGEKLIPMNRVKGFGESWNNEFDRLIFLECPNFNVITYREGDRYDNYLLVLDKKDNHIVRDRL